MNKENETHIIGNSSTIKSITYDFLMENLEVDFKSGLKYKYCGVPYKVFLEMKAAESAGKYFHSNVKNVYEFLKGKPKPQTLPSETKEVQVKS